MIENQNMYIKADEYDTFCSVKVSANDENTKYFFANNTGTIYNGTPDVAFETMVWIENPKCIIHHGLVWFTKESLPDIKYNEPVTMPYKWKGLVVKKVIVNLSEIHGTTTIANALYEQSSVQSVWILSIEGYVYVGAGQYQDIKSVVHFYGGDAGVQAISSDNSSDTYCTITYAVIV